ncbi:PhzA/PhzB family protein [Streptomyces sp. NEAU-S7GS2]|uniref:PhzA/PhzB family protein n=1 Tax=Streptomyces sp. NEAU-S7GS2 TaxID=2202000 RepID=UPI0023B7A7BD|nr:PhzA/PhzB family protein [Streptomyces sp. NEAU-S7GS2]
MYFLSTVHDAFAASNEVSPVQRIRRALHAGSRRAGFGMGIPQQSYGPALVGDTQDPNRFWVECDGEGQICFDGYPEGHYRNHFLHSFTFEGGKIKLQREFMNVCEQFRALGIAVPEVKRAGIPT